MQDLRIAAAQFETRDNDKPYNLGRIRELTRSAVEQGAQVVSFHEACIPAYTWVQKLTKEQMLDLAEPVPDGPSVRALIKIAAEFKTVVAAGLFERDAAGKIYNTYAVVAPDGLLASYRKIHPFVNPHLAPGNQFVVFDLLGWKAGISICYDNNLPENVRANALLGAKIVFMPHVTCGLPSPMPGRGVIDRALWDNRGRDPVALRQEFLGPKGRGWLMRWLPARAYENGIYAVFTNNVGWDHDTVKPGLAMILDPFGEVLVESHALGDDVVLGLVTEEKIAVSSGERYLRARKPELYSKLVEPPPLGQESVTAPGWMMQHQQPPTPAPADAAARGPPRPRPAQLRQQNGAPHLMEPPMRTLLPCLLLALVSLAAAPPAATAPAATAPATAPATSLLNFPLNGFSIHSLEAGSGNAECVPLRMFLAPTKTFPPNVNVVAGPVVSNTIELYLDSSKRQLQAANLDIVAVTVVDKRTANLEYTGKIMGQPAHWYVRVILGKGRAYMATAAASAEDWPKAAPALKACVDSLDAGDIRPPPDRLYLKEQGFSIAPLEVKADAATLTAVVLALPRGSHSAADVTVQITPSPGNIASFSERAHKLILARNFSILRDEKPDDHTAVIEYTGPQAGVPMHVYIRASLRAGRIYQATATTTETQWIESWQPLKACVDSFSLDQLAP